MKLFINVAAVYDRRIFTVTALLFACSTGTFVSAQTNATLPPLPPITNADTTPAVPQTDPFDDPLIKQVEARHEKAVAGDTKETKALTADLEKWVEDQPTNFLLQAYLGSVYTLDSRDSWPGPGKLTYLRKGGQWLDGAVNSAPDNPAVRFIRAIDYYSLPFFFGKGKTARDDFQVLLKQIDGEVKTPYVLDVKTQQAIYYYAGLSFKQLSQIPQAKDTWEKGIKLDPKSPLATKMNDELNKVK
jgi:hypothetical protein